MDTRRQNEKDTRRQNETQDKNENPVDFIEFWGVRGSIPSPGQRTAAVGGNTSCVEVQLGGTHVIFDGGSGLRQLGAARGGQPLSATLLFSHLHWDHIQGVPFFASLFHPHSELSLVGPEGLAVALELQMSLPNFPVGMDVFGARWSTRTIEAGGRFMLGDVEVRTAPLCHPGGAIGYRLEHAGRTVVYACDAEHPAVGHAPALLALAAGADVLIYDAQYLPEEVPLRVGWGHSTWEHGVALAQDAGVGQLVLTHHDPMRDDAAVFALEQQARRRFSDTWAAREGLVLPLSGRADGRHEVGELAHAALG